MARVPRERFVPDEPERARLRRRRAPDRTRPDDLAAVRGRHDLRPPRPATGASASSTSARVGLPGSRARRARCGGGHDRAHPRARRGAREHGSPTSDTANVEVTVGRRLARRARARAVRRDRGRGGRSDGPSGALTTSSPKAAVSSSRAARGSGRSSCSSRGHPTARRSARRSRVASSRSSATKGLVTTDRMGGGDDSAPEYPAMTVESSHAQIDAGFSPARVRAGMRKRKNWEQLFKFCVVGVTGYAVNLAVFASLVQAFSAPLHPGCRSASFLVAVTNNYTWNRIWTFRAPARRRRVPGRCASSSSRRSRSSRTLPSSTCSSRCGLVRVRRSGDRDRARHAGELRRQ